MDIAVLEPIHDIPLTRMPFLEAVRFAPDGRLYVHEMEATLNLWRLAVHYWPELLGGVSALMLVVLAVPILRVLRRPRIVGALHCRRCNYDLTDTPAGKLCPECGVDPAKRRPVVGRSTRRRLAWPVGMALVVLLLYSGLHLARAPRESWLNEEFNWS